jgi:Cu+-exporting ATPase
LSGAIVGWTLLLTAGFATAGVRASAGPPKQTGTFALLNATQKIDSTFWAVQGAGPLTATLHVRQFRHGSSNPILNYDVEMQSTIHVVAIRDDFATFNHLHPAFNTTTGTFTQSFTKQPNHRYYVYADTTPHGIGHQVFRFTMESDGPVSATAPALEISEPTATAGPYSVVLDKTSFPADQAFSIDLTVDKGTKLATDLGTYLGAPAHCVFINTATLEYVHVHPSVRNTTSSNGSNQMNMTGAGPRMRLSVPALPAGTYKLWIQFRGGAYKLYTVPFTIAVR